MADPLCLCSGELHLQPIREGLGAVQGHPQRVIVFAEIRIPDDLVPKRGGIERA